MAKSDTFFSANKMFSISDERKKKLLSFCENLGIKFHDITLLDLALHHRSFSNESEEFRHYNNERLEFLGDSVLGMSTAAFLYEDMMKNPEGDLAKIKSAVVSEKALAPIAKTMKIDTFLVLGKGEEKTGGREKSAILADAFEAVVGAFYLDSGFEAAEQLVLRYIIPEIRNMQQNRGRKDYKTLLQEMYQKICKECPIYELTKTDGPDHDRTFWVSVKLGEKIFGPCAGKNKKEAEQNAARQAYAMLAEQK